MNVNVLVESGEISEEEAQNHPQKILVAYRFFELIRQSEK